MPDINNNRKVVYDALVSSGYSGLGKDFDEFSSYMDKDENRRVVYNALRNEGYTGVGKDYDEFSSFVFATPEDERPQSGGGESIGEVGYMKPETTQEELPQGHTFTAEELGIEPEAEKKEEVFLYPLTKKPGVLSMSPQEHSRGLMEQAEARRKYEELSKMQGMTTGRKNVIESGGKFYTPMGVYDDYLEAVHYLDESGMTDRLTKASQKKIPLEEERKRLVAMRDEVQAKANEREKELRNSVGNYQFGMAPITGNQASAIADEQLAKYNATYNNLTEAIRELDDRIKEENPGFWRGVADATIKNPSFYTMGLSDASDARAVLDVSEKGVLSDDDENLLDALYTNKNLQETSKKGFRYRAGNMFGHSIPFMVQMAATGGYQGVSSIGTKVAGEVAKKTLKKRVLSALGTMADDLIEASLIANTAGGGSTLANVAERRAGKIAKDENGNYEFKDKDGWLEAAYKGEMSSILEMYSEKFGNHLDGKLSLVKGLDKLGASKLSKALLAVKSSDLYNGANTVLKSFGVNGILPEVLEEELNLVANALTVGDNKFSDLYDPQIQADIIGGLALTVGGMRVIPGTIASIGFAENMRRVNSADKKAQRVFGDIWEDMRTALNETPNEAVAKKVAEYLENTNKPSERESLLDYYKQMMVMRGYNIGTTKIKEVAPGAEAAYQEAYNSTPTGSEVVARTEALKEAEQSVRIALGLADDADLDFALGDTDAMVLANNDKETAEMIDRYRLLNAQYKGMQDAVKREVEERSEEYDASIDARANNGVVYSTKLRDGTEVFITAGKVVLNNEGFVDPQNSEGLIVQLPDGTKKPVRSIELVDEVRTKQAEELKAAERARITAEVEQRLREEGASTDGVESAQPATENATETATETTQALPKEKQEVQSIPMEKRGKVERAAYHLVSIERTMEDLHDGTLEPEEIEGLIDARVKEAESDVKAVEKKKPVIGADKNAYLTAKEQWKADMEAAQAKLDYYNRLKKVNAEATRSEMRDVVEGVQPQVLIEQTADEFVANLLGGIKITPESFQRETGLKGEQKQLVGVIAGADKGGITVEQAAEQIVENYGDELAGLGFNGDVQDMRDMIINILSNGNPRSYAKRGAEMRAAQSVDEQMSQWESLAIGMGFKDTQEMIEYEEAVVPRIIQDYTGFDEIEYFNNLAENYKYDTTRESESAGRGSELLQGKQSADNAGDTNIAESGQGGNVQGDVYSGGENAASQGNQQQIGSSEIPNNQIPGLKGYTTDEVLNLTKGHITDILGGDISIVDMRVIGSRSNGTNSENSDLDVLVEFDGDISEDAFFNAVNGEDALYIDGVRVDINPITKDKSGTIEQWMNRNAGYSKTEGGNAPGQGGVSVADDAPAGKRVPNTLEELAQTVLDKAEDNRRKPLRKRAEKWAKKLGVKVHILESYDEVTDEQAKVAILEQRVPGWFAGGEVYIYMPHLVDEVDLDRTVVHETVAHKGIKQMLGEEFNKFLDNVWNAMSDRDQMKYLGYIGAIDENGNLIDNPTRGQMRAAADEYVAALAEKVYKKQGMTAEEKNIWQKVADWVRSLFTEKFNADEAKAEVLAKETLTDEDIAKMIRASYETLQSNRVDNEGIKPINEGRTMFSKTSEQIEELFDKAVAGELTGKAVPVGKLTKAGKAYLESISGLTIKDNVNFVLNPSDLLHIYKNHYEENEKDKGNNIPLNKHDIRRMVDVIAFPTTVVYGESENGRKSFFFLMDTPGGAYNLLEIYADKKGNLSSKTYYKTKKGVSQRVMNILNSLHSTSATDGATLSNAKVPQMFENTKSLEENSSISQGNGTMFRKVTPEMNAEYMSAVENGDMETAERLVKEAAKLAMPDTKVVDENGEPMVVYHGDRKKSRYKFSTDTFFTPDANYARRYTGGTGEVYSTYLNIEKPFDIRDQKAYDIFTEFRGGRIPAETMTGAMDWGEYSYEDLQEFVEEFYPGAYDGFILDEGGEPDYYDNIVHRGLSYVPFSPTQIKSAETVTYDDNGNVIPLSERFNEEKDDIRFRKANEKDYIVRDFDGEHKVFNLLNDAETIEFFSRGISYEPALVEKFNTWLKSHKNDYVRLYHGTSSRHNMQKEGILKTTAKRRNSYQSESGYVYLSLYPDSARMFREMAYPYDETIVYSVDLKIGELRPDIDQLNNQRAAGMKELGNTLADSLIYGNGARVKRTVLPREIGATRFRIANKNQEIFVSNARKAVEEIKQEKATPQQWLAMIKKNGGLKAGEDKWMGLSEWLENNESKSLTKQEVFDFVNENAIKIEEVRYNGDTDVYSSHDIYETEEFTDLNSSLIEYDEEENPYINREEYERLRNENPDFFDGFSIDYWGEGIDVNDPKAAARYLGLTKERPINDTRLDYTTEGLDNKREIALVVPTIEPYNESDEVHFGDAGNGRAVAWVRFGETTDSEGNRVLVVDEIQSKRHQDAREKGYATEDYIYAKRERDYLYKKMYEKGLTEEEHERYKWLQQYTADNFGVVPDAPFDKNWQELAMKRMLRLAAEEGFDKVAWTTGEQQAERYALSRSVADVVSEDNNTEVFENGVVVAKDIRITTNTGSAIDIKTEEDGTIHGGEYDGKNIGDVVGKELAAKLMNPGYVFLSGDGLRIGGEGMKGFYDKMLPSFVSKYAKKWGAKVGTVEMPSLEQNNVMHSVDVTPEMKESVMEGQTMFRFIGEKGARSLDRREEENGDFNFTPRRGVSTEQREEKMNTRTEELAKALNERGFDTTISKSRTSFGMSNYIIVRSKSGEVLKKIRLSDHSVTNTGRVLNEYHTMSTDTVEGIVADLMGEKEREIGNRISNLTNAKYMESRGKDAKTIKLATGWERGADGKWRYETEDAKVNREAQLFDLNDNKRYPVAEFIKKGRVDIDATVRLDKLIDDEALFDAYPELREYYVTFEEMEPGTVGSHNYDDKVIRFNRRESIDKLSSTLNHEIQHAVQHIEGFALGGNLSTVKAIGAKIPVHLGSAMDIVEKIEEPTVEKLRAVLEDGDIYAYEAQQIREMLRDIEDGKYTLNDVINARKSGADVYNRLAGEVESRNVQERMGMTPEERRNSLAEETADVAKEDQIFLFDNLGVSAMGSRENKRMAEIGEYFKGMGLTDNQQTIVDVFSGEKNNKPISVKSKDGDTRNVIMRQGKAEKAGTKHSVVNHFSDSQNGYYTAEELLVIEDVLANGERKKSERRGITVHEYTLNKDGVEYTVITEINNRKDEVFANFYTNRKASSTTRKTRSEEARDIADNASEDKGSDNSLNEQEESTLFRKMAEKQSEDELALTADAVAALGEKMGVPVRVVTDAPEKRKKLKGWFENGEVVVALPNLVSMEDAVTTVLHEVVGRRGLRQVMGDKMDELLDVAYNGLSTNVKSVINNRVMRSLLDGKPMDKRVAMEEYLSNLAKNGFEGNEKLWGDVKQLLGGFLNEYAGVEIPDGEMRYLLWKNYQRLQMPSVMTAAEDLAMEVKTQTGEFTTLFRVTDDYERGVRGFRNKFKEGWYDEMRSLKVAQDAIEKELGREIADSENVYLKMNHLPSVNKAMKESFDNKFLRPFTKLLSSLSKFGLDGKAIDNKTVERYSNAKHGLERNREMAVKEALTRIEKNDGKRTVIFNNEGYEAWKKGKEAIVKDKSLTWREKQDKLDKLANTFGAKIDDFSGFTALFAGEKKMSYDEMRNEAMDFVERFEGAIGEDNVKEFWDLVKGMTGFALKQSYTSGLLGKGVYDSISSMYEWYVPLRGFNEKTAEDYFDYVVEDNMPLNATLVRARGRKSEAGNIFATILNMANSAIVQGNKNKAKQALMNLANSGTGLLSVDNAWYWKNGDEYVPASPDIKEGMTPEEMAEAFAAFDEKMKMAEKKDLATRYKPGLAIDANFDKRAHKNQHAVIVKRNGIEYVVWVNASPTLANAVNGLLRVEYDAGWIDSINRFRASAVTQYSPQFVLTNAARDAQSSSIVYALRRGKAMLGKYIRNVGDNVLEMPELYMKYKNGTLDMNVAKERLFKEFLENGGETGYSEMLSIEEYEKILNKLTEGLNIKNATVRAFEAAGGLVEFANRSVENLYRFSAYQTSREAGISILKSIEDAKEVSVNFNRKGSGAYGNAFFKKTTMFLNPAIQSAAQRIVLASKAPKEMVGLLAAEFALGALQPLLFGFLSSLWGDDEEDKMGNYYNLTDYRRRSSLCLPLPNGVINIPLSHEERVFFGLGELLSSVMMGHEDYDNIPMQAFNVIAQALPINPVDGWTWDDNLGETLIANLSPDFVKPIVEVAMNRDFAGNKVHNRTDFNTHLPEYLRGKGGTARPFMWLSELMSGAEQGTAKTWADRNLGAAVNPSAMEHIVKGYLGGAYTFADKFAKSALALLGDEEFAEVKNIPLLSSFYTDMENYEASPQERTRRDWERAYNYYKDEVKLLDDQEKTAKVLVRSEDKGGADVLEAMKSDGRTLIVDVFGDGEKLLKELYGEVDAAKKAKDFDRVKELDDEIYGQKRIIVERMEKMAENPMIGYTFRVMKDEDAYGLRETYGDVRDAQMITDFKRSLKPVIEEEKRLSTGAKEKENEAWKKIKDLSERISKAKGLMDVKPQEADELMTQIRNWRSEAVELINKYNE